MIKKHAKNCVVEILYFLITIIFLIKINVLNKELIFDNEFMNDLELLSYKEYLPIKYLFFTLLLLFLGLTLGLRNINKIVYREVEFVEMVQIIVVLFGIGIMFILLFEAINYPILKAAVSVVVFYGVCGYAVSYR